MRLLSLFVLLLALVALSSSIQSKLVDPEAFVDDIGGDSLNLDQALPVRNTRSYFGNRAESYSSVSTDEEEDDTTTSSSSSNNNIVAKAPNAWGNQDSSSACASSCVSSCSDGFISVGKCSGSLVCCQQYDLITPGQSIEISEQILLTQRIARLEQLPEKTQILVQKLHNNHIETQKTQHEKEAKKRGSFLSSPYAIMALILGSTLLLSVLVVATIKYRQAKAANEIRKANELLHRLSVEDDYSQGPYIRAL